MNFSWQSQVPLSFVLRNAAKLANPDSEVISLVGDGCYSFGVPNSTYWVASTYDAPFLTVIYNNGGWGAPRHSTLQVHPEGSAKQNDTFWSTMTAGVRLADIAAASGDVEAFSVSEREHLRETLARAMETVRGGRCAVVDVAVTRFSAQVLGEERSAIRSSEPLVVTCM